jgi:hypothetical protein
MSTPPIPEVLIPFLKKKVPLIVDLDDHPAMNLIKKWGPVLKKKIEEACFANYKNKVASIGMNPSLPRIRKPNEVWKHLEVESIRIDARIDDAIVIHVVPAWDIDLQMELCIKGDRIVYAGQFLMYSVDGYTKIGKRQRGE